MVRLMKTDSFAKKLVTGVVAATLLAACGGNEGGGAMSAGEAVKLYEEAGDHAIGSKDAPVVVVEYASVVCPGCANWHNTVYPDFKKKYIETGKVRFIFREFPTHPERLAFAGFTIANCADKSKFLQNISIQFKRQQALVRAKERGKAYEELARASGLSVDEYKACLKDENWIKEYEDGIEAARAKGVNSTPTFFVNGKMYSSTNLFTIEQFDDALKPLLNEPAE